MSFSLKHIHTSVVLLNKGPSAGKTATIVEIIDHKRVCLLRLLCLPCNLFLTIAIRPLGPHRRPNNRCTSPILPLPASVAHLFLVPDLPRAAGTAIVKKYIEKAGVDEKWVNTSWAKKRAW
jgi:large subunit ribosomal protein L14e